MRKGPNFLYANQYDNFCRDPFQALEFALFLGGGKKEKK